MLILMFVFVCALSFGVIVFVLRPSQEQKALDRRIATIGAQRTPIGVVSKELEQYLKAEVTSSFTWLEGFVKDSSVAGTLRLLILQANVRTTVASLVVWCLAASAVSFGLTFVFVRMIPVALLGALAAGAIPIVVLRLKRAKRLKAFNGALADCIDMMSRSLRAGHSLPAAIGIVAEQALEPARSEFAEVSRQQNYGLPMRDAMNQLFDRIPSQDLRVVATGILVQKDTGGNLAEVLDRIGAVIRDRVRIQGEIRTHTAQGRLTGWILCMLPVVMLVLINMVNPGYSKPLFNDPTGIKIMYLGVGLLIVGGLVIRKIIRGIEI